MQMEAMNAEFSVRNQNRTSMRSNRVNRNNCDPPDVAHTFDSLHAMNDRELMQTYSEKEQKLSKLDTLYSAIRNFLHGSSRITSDEELDKALHQLSELREEAQHFIMLCYYDDDENPTCKRRIPPESSRSVKSEHKSDAQKICFEYEDLTCKGKGTNWDSQAPRGAHSQTISDKDSFVPTDTGNTSEPFVRVKDQIIYELLQERATLCKEKADLEAQVHELSELSAEEMKKWATLTDNMQVEIEKLRYALQCNTPSLQFP